MIHTYSVKSGPGAKRYRYYVCLAAQKRGWDSCPSKSVPAGEIEAFVVGQIRSAGRDPAVLEGTLRQIRQQHAKAVADLRTEQKVAGRELARHHAALKKLAAAPDTDRLVALHEQIGVTEKRLATVREKLLAHEQQHIEPEQVRSALAAFDPVWEQLAPKEQARVIQLLVDRVEYDGRAGTVSVTFHPTGIGELEIHRADGVFEALKLRASELPRKPDLVQATFSVRFAGSRQPRRVTVRPPSTALYTREEDAHLVEQWLLLRGFVRQPEPSRHDEADQELLAIA
jgi:hypothetical protein